MRIICPNCGAQYEVPDEVIPLDGRDVQCSNCGDTWYQTHPDAMLDQELAGDDSDGLPEAAPESMPPPPQFETETEIEEELDMESDIDEVPDVLRERAGQPRRELSPDVADILRTEAEHEARLREAESSVFESQGELGLEEAPATDTVRRVREARERMALMRGKAPDAQPTLTPDEAPSRKQFLPDIDELNSSLRAEGPGGKNADLPVRHQSSEKSKRGFGRGFTLMLLLAAILVLVYVNADRIATNLPALRPTLDTYVAFINDARIWLDTQIRQLTP